MFPNWLVITANLSILLFLPSVTAHNSATAGHLSRRRLGRFEIVDCDATRTNLLNAQIELSVKMIERTQERTNTLVDMLEGLSEHEPADRAIMSDFLPQEQAALQTFEVIFGRVWDHENSDSTKLSVVNAVKEGIDALFIGAENIRTLPVDIYCGDQWIQYESDDYTEEFGDCYDEDKSVDTTFNDDREYWDGSGNCYGKVWTETTCSKRAYGLCANNPNGRGSIVSICPNRFDTSAITTLLADMGDAVATEDLNHFSNAEVAGTLIHEMTHSREIMGELLTFDEGYQDGVDANGQAIITKAYGWVNVAALGHRDQGAALNNAESYMFWVLAMWMRGNNWCTGSPQPFTASEADDGSD